MIEKHEVTTRVNTDTANEHIDRVADELAELNEPFVLLYRRGETEVGMASHGLSPEGVALILEVALTGMEKDVLPEVDGGA